jgi:hypothetical protein
MLVYMAKNYIKQRIFAHSEKKIHRNKIQLAMYFLKDVLVKEQEQLLQRRKNLAIEHGSKDQKGKENHDFFGIALSGGGIRSATINLGFLKTLNKFGILKKADYLSTVSGGGYTHSYIQTTLKETGSYDRLFTDEHANAFRKHGEYMIPGAGGWKYFNTLLLTISFLVSWLMSLISPVVIGGIIYYGYAIITGLIGQNTIGEYIAPDTDLIAKYGMYLLGGLFTLHFLSNVILNFNLNISKLFNRIEAVVAVVGIAIYFWILLSNYKGVERIHINAIGDYAINMALLFIIGFFTNPNSLSFHRYYRKQLADLFLKFAGKNENIPLKDVFKTDGSQVEHLAPYPLINTCLNLQNPSGDEKFKGTKASDYFLLSPMFCGSKLTAYVPTSKYHDYQKMTLPAAVTISAAAVNPGMGIYSSKLLSIVMTIFNARLGFWITNPLKVDKSRAFVWWPIYFFKELLGRIGTDNKMVNISDGGHIENLGVYELLRRNCRLIVAFDAGEDKNYGFSDLNNLLIRARNELGLEIRFREDQQPEKLLRPEPSQVYSKQRYAIADIYQWWVDEKIIKDDKEVPNIRNFDEPQKVGTFVYVKSSVLAPYGKPYLSEKEDYLKYGTYKYKIYHPDFPHEPTSDQFFDEIQWEAYYQLGQYIGADVLGLKDLEGYKDQVAPDFSVNQLIQHFDAPKAKVLFGEESKTRSLDDEFESMKPSAGTKGALPMEEKPAVKYSM